VHLRLAARSVDAVADDYLAKPFALAFACRG
jgi:DNA-binding response OmpR family regulator